MKAKKGSSFKGKVAKASKRSAQQGSKYGYLNLPKGVSVFSAESDTRVTLDFLPYKVTGSNHPDKDEKEGIAVKGSYWYRRPFKIHRNIGSSNDSAVCLTSIGKKCPVCEYKIKRAKEGADKEELAALKTSDRMLYVINPLDSKKHDAGKWHIFDISVAMFQKLLDDEIDEESINDYFMDLEEGSSLKIRFTGKTIGNGKPFPEATKITAVDRKNPYPEEVQDETPHLDDILTIMSYEELERKFFEIEAEDTDEEEEDATPSRKKKSTKKVEEPEEEEEEPEEEEEEDETEEEEEPTPPVRRAKTPPPAKKSKKNTATWEELQAMNFSKLTAYVEKEEVDLDPDDFEDDPKAFRKAIAEEQGIIILPKAGGKVPPSKTVNKNYKPAKKEEPEDDDEEEEEDEEEEKPAKKSTKVKPSIKSSDKCPSGHRFGVDTDKKDDCDSCDLWDECMAAKKKAK